MHAKKYQLPEKKSRTEMNDNCWQLLLFSNLYFSLCYYDFYRYREDNNDCEVLDFYVGYDICLKYNAYRIFKQLCSRHTSSLESHAGKIACDISNTSDGVTEKGF